MRGDIEEARRTGIPGRIKNTINRFLFMAYKKYILLLVPVSWSTGNRTEDSIYRKLLVGG